MKKTTLIAGICCLVGALILIFSIVAVKGDVSQFSMPPKSEGERSYVAQNNIDTIELSERSQRVRIYEGNVDHVTINYYAPDEDDYDIYEKDGTLVINKKAVIRVNFQFFSIGDFETVIIVPRDSEKINLDVENSSGSIYIEDMTLDALNVKDKSGKIRIYNTTVDKDAEISNKSGSIKIEKFDVKGDLAVEDSSGSIKLTDVTAANIEAKDKSGGIELENTTAETYRINNSSSSIKLERVYVGKSISLANKSGSIKGSIVGEDSDFSKIINIKNGSSNLVSSHEGEKELFAENKSGSIKIEFVK